VVAQCARLHVTDFKGRVHRATKHQQTSAAQEQDLFVFGGDCLEAKPRLNLVLQIHIRQSGAVEQYDLPLGLAEEAEDTLAVQL
jgi:hypothetical protein